MEKEWKIFGLDSSLSFNPETGVMSHELDQALGFGDYEFDLSYTDASELAVALEAYMDRLAGRTGA